MKPDRRRPRPRARLLAALGALPVALALGLGFLPLAAARARHAAAGSGCAHPIIVTARYGEEEEKLYGRFSTLVGRGHVDWGVEPGSDYMVCSARIQLQDGSWAKPTPPERVLPSNGGPLPPILRGAYQETSDPRSRFRKAVIAFARSPVPQGSSCKYPLMTTALGGDERDYRVVWRPNTPTRASYEFRVLARRPNLAVCSATVEKVENYGEHTERVLRVYHPTVSAQGGLSSPLPAPQRYNEVLLVWVYAVDSFMLHHPKPPRPKPSGCTLTTRYYAMGFETGDTKDMTIKFAEIGKHVPSEPWKLKAEVTIHNRRVTICHATMLWTEATASGAVTGVKSTPVTIGTHGGASAPVTLPPYAFSPELQVYARRN